MKRAMAVAGVAASLLGGPMAGAALAQTGSSAPVDISADEQETISSQCKTIFRGAVEVLQETSRLRAAKMTLYNQKKPGGGGNGCGNVDRVEAEGEVFYVTPKQTVRGDRATYDYASDTIVVTGNVIAIQGQDVARGDRMVVNTKTNDVRMESSVKGAGKKNRVRAVVYPSTSDDSKKPAASKP
ncbi:LPS export ABC transporter periplasmic protein LptC [Caulobacter hibisci]|uniref:LPS export ABC transporter periplasmic protein LptC n=2 Tax=Caulobacter hibisci TaxID=2035993 RepID=A0ABS0SUR5_9CAUL|nr:LptA/OstA family protein [Caulobacter hibisci]MBI1683259.1 LPS export ABC transporter periplasmic protein LptC [Caulobacter hibisci]